MSLSGVRPMVRTMRAPTREIELTEDGLVLLSRRPRRWDYGECASDANASAAGPRALASPAGL